MSNVAANVRVAVTGKFYSGPTSAVAPTNSSTAPDASLIDMGYISDDGVEFTPPGGGDSTPIKVWQNGETVRTLRTPSEDLPTWHLTLVETKLEVVELYLGVTVTQTSTDGSFTYKVTNAEHMSFLLDVVDGAELIRHYIPYGVVTDVGAQTFSNGDPIGYEITIAGELDPAKDYNFKGFATALKSAA